MSTTGAFEFKLSPAAKGGVVEDENVIGRGKWAWIDRTQEWGSIDPQTTVRRRWLMVYARCLDCGLLCTLWRIGQRPGHNHEIDCQGNLSPSVECPHEGCKFHTQPTRLLNFIDLREE